MIRTSQTSDPWTKLDDTLLRGVNLEQIEESGEHRIEIPVYANIASDTIGRHVANGAANETAVIQAHGDENPVHYTYGQLDRDSGVMAAGLVHLGIEKGDRIAIHLNQGYETVVSHMAIYKIGAIAVPISARAGATTVLHILNDSGACLVITQTGQWKRLSAQGYTAQTRCKPVLVDGKGMEQQATTFTELLAGDKALDPIRTTSDTPALLIYTSGSTAEPKGILHNHGIIWAYNVSMSWFYNLELCEPDLVLWTPADWAWVGGLNDTVFPALFHGHSVVASNQLFSGEFAFNLMEQHRVTHVFMTASGLKLLADIQSPEQRWPDLQLRTVCTGGEALPGSVFEQLVQKLGITVNEFYGLTEVNHMIGTCSRIRPPKAGSMGYVTPGHKVWLVDEHGAEVPQGSVGEIVTSNDCKTLYQGYWKRPDLDETLKLGPWIRTGDMAVEDTEGYFYYKGRADDLIKSSGFRISPIEIEECLLQHSAVADCGVVGLKDPDRGQAIHAFIVPAVSVETPSDLIEELTTYVRSRLGLTKTPHQFRLADLLPLTSSGKISRKILRNIA